MFSDRPKRRREIAGPQCQWARLVEANHHDEARVFVDHLEGPAEELVRRIACELYLCISMRTQNAGRTAQLRGAPLHATGPGKA